MATSSRCRASGAPNPCHPLRPLCSITVPSQSAQNAEFDAGSGPESFEEPRAACFTSDLAQFLGRRRPNRCTARSSPSRRLCGACRSRTPIGAALPANSADAPPIAVGVGNCECLAEGPPLNGSFSPTCSESNVPWVWSRLWSFRAREGYPLTLLGAFARAVAAS